LEVGSWRLEVGEWRVEDGEWGREGAGSEGKESRGKRQEEGVHASVREV
jgi:hypothetical protein